jgi:hypothetical protein
MGEELAPPGRRSAWMRAFVKVPQKLSEHAPLSGHEPSFPHRRCGAAKMRPQTVEGAGIYAVARKPKESIHAVLTAYELQRGVRRPAILRCGGLARLAKCRGDRGDR